MRTSKRLRRALIPSLALITALAIGNAASASAASWSPSGTTAAAVPATSIQFQPMPMATPIVCGSSGMTLTTAVGAFAVTQLNSVTFSSCTSGLPFPLPTTVTASGVWGVTATSTSTATIQIPVNGFKISKGSPTECTITVGPGAVNIAATWSNASHSLYTSGPNVPYTASGSNIAACGGQPSGQMSFRIGGAVSNGWRFPTLSIV